MSIKINRNMEHTQLSIPIATMEKVLLAVSVVVVILIVSKLMKCLLVTKPKLKLPPGPWTLPLIGSMHHLVLSNPLPFRAIRDLAHKHGPLMMLWLGEVPTLVVSSPEAAQAITKTHDIMFADRHMNSTVSIFTFNGNDLVFGRYGEQWRQLRKLCVLELLGAARMHSFQRIREEEVVRFIRSLATSAGVGAAVDLSKMISSLGNDTFVRESIGSRCKYRDEYLDAMETAMKMATELSLANIFPSSRLLRNLSMVPRKAVACRDRMARIIGQIIGETKEAMDRGDNTSNESLVSVLLSLQRDASLPIELTDDIVMALMLNLFAAGSDTSATTLTWCMTELIRHPATMARAQSEVREAFKGKITTTITEDDLARANLSYLKCVVKEALRLHCPAPLLIPRKCRETCQVMGYDIPKGTCVFINVWAICRDSMYWENAEEFNPERFENTNLDYKGTDYEFLPFGSGRRMCPGINLGLANMELALASLLYHFDWKLPSGVEPKDVDVWEAAGLVGRKNTGLVLHPVTQFAPVNA